MSSGISCQPGAEADLSQDTAGVPTDAAPPALSALFVCFMLIGMQSFGGGLSAWMRREVVQKRGWLDERPFLSGLALSQIAPGANAVNMAVFTGATLRGVAGAVAALAGMLVLPLVFVLGIGALYFSGRQVPHLEQALNGVGAAAIGLTLATGLRMWGRNVRDVRQAIVMAVVALGVGVLRLPLLLVLAVMVPVSIISQRGRD
jgi:chromate transporter